MKKKLHLIILLVLLTSVHLQSQNLILNHSCDDTLINGKIPYWQEIVGTVWTQRSATPSPLPQNGIFYFYGGHISVAELSQVVDISSDSMLILIINNCLKHWEYGLR